MDDPDGYSFNTYQIKIQPVGTVVVYKLLST